MSAQVTITLIDGRVIQGLNYRMSTTSTPSTAAGVVPTAPGLTGGEYHIETANGWLDIPANQVVSVVQHPGRPT